MRVSHVRLVLLIALVVSALSCQIRFAGAQGAEVTHENLAYNGCFASHQFDVCAQISGERHQIVTPEGRVISGFTETSCFVVTTFGEFVSQRCQKEHFAEMTVEGFLTRAHDSGRMEFTDGVQTCSGRFLLRIAHGQLVLSESNVVCV